MTEYTTKDWSDDVQDKYQCIGIGGKFVKDKAFMKKNEQKLKRSGYIKKVKVLADERFNGKIKIFYCKDNKEDFKLMKIVAERMGTIISEETL